MTFKVHIDLKFDYDLDYDLGGYVKVKFTTILNFKVD